MVDLPARASLKAALADLIEGRITNDQFADFHCERCIESPDRAVQAIGEFGDSLYTDAMSYRLVGRHAIDDGTRRTAERCLQFLETAEEYGWPDGPDMVVRSAAGGATVFFILPFGVVLLMAAGLLWTANLLLAGLAVLGLGGFLWWWSRDQNTQEWREFWAHGEREAWPFLHRLEKPHIASPEQGVGVAAKTSVGNPPRRSSCFED